MAKKIGLDTSKKRNENIIDTLTKQVQQKKASQLLGSQPVKDRGTQAGEITKNYISSMNRGSANTPLVSGINERKTSDIFDTLLNGRKTENTAAAVSGRKTVDTQMDALMTNKGRASDYAMTETVQPERTKRTSVELNPGNADRLDTLLGGKKKTEESFSKISRADAGKKEITEEERIAQNIPRSREAQNGMIDNSLLKGQRKNQMQMIAPGINQTGKERSIAETQKLSAENREDPAKAIARNLTETDSWKAAKSSGKKQEIPERQAEESGRNIPGNDIISRLIGGGALAKAESPVANINPADQEQKDDRLSRENPREHAEGTALEIYLRRDADQLKKMAARRYEDQTAGNGPGLNGAGITKNDQASRRTIDELEELKADYFKGEMPEKMSPEAATDWWAKKSALREAGRFDPEEGDYNGLMFGDYSTFSPKARERARNGWKEYISNAQGLVDILNGPKDYSYATALTEDGHEVTEDELAGWSSNVWNRVVQERYPDKNSFNFMSDDVSVHFEDVQNNEWVLSSFYDTINGEGAYKRATSLMNDSEKAAFDGKILRAVAATGVIDSNDKTAGLQGSIDFGNDQIGTLDYWDQNDANYSRIQQGRTEEYDALLAERDRLTAEYDSLEPGDHRREQLKWKINDVNKRIIEADEANWESRVMEDEDLTGEYRPALDVENANNYNFMWFENAGSNTGTPQEIYSFVSGGKVRQAYDANAGGEVSPVMHYAMMMTPQEKERFMRLYEGDFGTDKAAAMAYLDSLQPYLTRRYSEWSGARNREFAENYPVAASAVNRLINFFAPAMEVGRRIAGDFGDREVNDPYGRFFTGQQFMNDTEGVIVNNLQQKYGKVAVLGYQAGMSFLDDTLRQLSTMGLSAAGFIGPSSGAMELTSLSMFGGQAYPREYYEAMIRTNGDVDKSTKIALLKTAVEIGTEVWSTGVIFGEGNSFSTKALISGLAEASEEITGGIVGPFAERLFFGKSDYDRQADEIWMAAQQNGGIYYDENGNPVKIDNFNTAYNYMVENSWIPDILNSAGSAMIGGTLGAVGVEGFNTAYQARTGRNILSGTDMSGEKIRNGSGKTSIALETVLTVGENMGEDTESKQRADNLRTRIRDGEKLRARDVGKLVESIYVEGSAETAKESERIYADVIASELKEKGVEEDRAKAASELIAKARVEGTEALTKAEKQQLMQDETAYQTYLALLKNENASAEGKAIAEKAEKSASEVPTIAEKIEGTQMSIGMQRRLKYMNEQARADSIAKTAQMASKQQLGTAIGNRTGTAADVVVGNRIGQVTGFKEDAKTGEILATVKFDDGTEDVGLSEVYGTDSNVAGLVKYAQVFKGSMTPEYLTAAVRTAQELGENINDKYLAEAERISLAAWFGESMPTVSMEKTAAENLYKIAQAEQQAAEDRRTQNPAQALNPGKGRSVYNGVEYGSKGWKAELNKLPENIRKNDINVLAELNRRLGFDLVFINNPNDTDMFGYENGNTGRITVNLAAMNANEKGRSYLTIAGHEFTHWLQNNSKAGYASLRNFIIKSYRQEGKSVENMVLDKLASYQSGLKARSDEETAALREKDQNAEAVKPQRFVLEDAIYEVIAEASDQVLASDEMAKRLQAEDPNLYGKFKQFIKNFFSNLKQAIGYMRDSGSISRESAALMRAEIREGIAKHWLAAYDEAMGVERPTEFAAGEEGKINYSQAESMVAETPEQDLRYGLADKRVRDYLSSWARSHIQDNNFNKRQILERYGIKEGQLAESNVKMSAKDRKALENIERENEKWEQRRIAAMGLDEDDLGAQYIQAWKNSDFDRMGEILMEKMSGIDGIIAYKAPNWYDSEQHRYVAKAIKTKDRMAIARAAFEMSQLVPKNAVLIPMPPHTGKVTEDTDTMVLARAISELTKRPVVNALESDEHMSRKEAKEKGIKLKAEDMGFRQVEEIPDGMLPIFIDNVVGTGETAKAAHDALGKGITLAYAKSSRAALPTMKNADPTYLDPNHIWLIPLDERYDMEKKGADGLKYSFKDSYGNDVNMTEEQMEENKNIVSRMKPVINIKENRFAKNTEKNFKTMAMEYFGEEGKIATNKIIGDVEVGEDGVQHLIMWLTSRRAGVIEAIIPVIENGEIINITENDGRHKFDSATIAAPIIYMGKPYYMGVVIEQNKLQKNKYYMHDAIIAEIEEEAAPLNKSLSKQTLGANPSIAMVLKTLPNYNGLSGSKNDYEQNDTSYSFRQTETEQFKNWFGESKVVNKDGTPKIMYHGTQNQFTVFDKKKARSSGKFGRGFYFTDSPSHAGQYGNNMAVYLKAEIPLSNDARISKQQLIRLLEEIYESEDYDLDNYGRGSTPESVANSIYANGKSALTMIGDVDGSAVGDFAETLRMFNEANGTNYDSVITDMETVVYSPNQIKSATDNIGTFDINNPDIRYSFRQADNAYMKAVENEDTDAAQSYVNQAAERAGYTDKVYHGTNDFGFTSFDLDKGQGTIFVSYHKNVAGTYAEAGDAIRHINEVDRLDVDFSSMTPKEIADYLNNMSEKEKAIFERVGMGFKSASADDDGWINIEIDDEQSTGFDKTDFILELDKLNTGVYELYAKPGKQLVVDAWNQGWDNIPWGAVIEADHDAETNEEDWDRKATTRDVAKWAKEHGYDSLRINNVYDNGEQSFDYADGFGDIGIFFNSSDVKSADAVVYDEEGNIIPPSERFNPGKTDIRYSIGESEITNSEGDVMAEQLPSGNITAYSLRTVNDTVDDELIRQLVAKGFGEKKVKKWVRDVFSVARYIADNRQRLDYREGPGTMLKNNAEYVKTLDASTLCAKRLLYQGIFNEIQKMLPNTPLLPDDLIKLQNMMRKDGLVTPCSFCYVESRRKMLGAYAEKWIKEYDGAYKPTIAEVTTTDGLEGLRTSEDPAKQKAYDDFVEAMNAKGSANPKVVQLRTDYKGEIKNLTDKQIEKVKSIGGLRVQSFSDFEVVHLLDMMQAVMDMAAKDLTSQAYTKVPAFAWVFGDTGIKINLSLVGKGTGLDANGNLVFDNVEGMDIDEAMKLREAYSKNVGTILVGINEDHIIAAMGDDRIDFIIPFHKSGWSKREMGLITEMASYKDHTRWQNEKKIESVSKDGKIKTIPNKKSKITNFEPVGPNGYWDFSKTGQQNAERYLKMCKEDGRVPKFSQFLVNNGDGSFSLPQGNDQRSENIRKGYWKLLIDFKMYDNAGKGSPQTEVTPKFNMKKAMEIMETYDGPTNELPTNHKVAQQFAEEYKAEHPRKSYSIRTPGDLDINKWMMTVTPGMLRTDAERKLQAEFKGMKTKIDLERERQIKFKNELAVLEAKDQMTPKEKSQADGLKIRIQNSQKAVQQLEEKWYESMATDGYANLMYNQHNIMEAYTSGKTVSQVRESVEAMQRKNEEAQKDIEKLRAELTELAESKEVRRIRALVNNDKLSELATRLRKDYNSSIDKQDLMNELARIRLKMQRGQDATEDVENLAGRIVDDMRADADPILTQMRGLTIQVTPEQIKELKGRGESLKTIRSKLAGTGIKVKQGKVNTLVDNLSDLQERFGADFDFGGEKDALSNFADWVENRKYGGTETRDAYRQSMADVMSDVFGTIAQVEMNLPKDKATRDQFMQLFQYVEEIAKRAEKGAEVMAGMKAAMQGAIESGKSAAVWTDRLRDDVDATIEYFNKTAKLAEETAQSRRVREVIEQLKNKHVEEMLKKNEEWRNLIERDRNARMQNEANNAKRRIITTDATRLMKLLSAPKGEKVVPEHMNGMARRIIELLVDNDLGGRKVTGIDKKALIEYKRRLNAWNQRDGAFNADEMQLADDNVTELAKMDLAYIEDQLANWNSKYYGKNKLDTLEKMGETLKQLQETVSELYSIIKQEQSIEIGDRRVLVADQAYKVQQAIAGRKFREWNGKAGKAIAALHKGIVSGNMTPEYFFRTLRNEGMWDLWEEYHKAENRNGLELARSKDRLAEIAKKHGYSSWDMGERKTLEMANGDKVSMTIGQLMSLYATWNREQQLGPEMSNHLKKGGFFVDESDPNRGIISRVLNEKRAHRVTEADMDKVNNLLTEEQKQFVYDVVQYMSNEMSELGNEASMKAYGIKMYKEKYYFPFKIWDGVKSRTSNDAGNGANIDRAFHPSFSKARTHNAGNALILGDFMQTAADHIAGMINYATMGLANETLQKVLNYKEQQDGSGAGEDTVRNIRAMLEEAYGRTAMNYLEDLKTQLNGGAVRIDRTFYDKLISLFRKNAVAGSLSVAAQQPLSYIRAAMLIDPKYLARALAPDMWRGSYKEMMEHSGVAVIKEMGRFDMNAGQSAREYLLPDGFKGKGQAAYDKAVELATMLPERMDRMTWTRMWSAVKAEQMALNPKADPKSEAFLDKVAERFNEVMRRTQVYDSVLVRSRNMRNPNPAVKGITSFMAEPTLTLNVLADSVRMAIQGEKGGKAMAAKAGATFMLSAVMQSVIKAIFSAGRTPDEKKTLLENFLYRLETNLIGELNPLSMIPGYSDLVNILEKGKIEDDALGVIGKIISAGETAADILLGKSDKSAHRAIEDSAGQLVQIFTGVPLKNIMRDGRAIYNWISGAPYADRPTNPNVLKYQGEAAFWDADSIISAINSKLGDAGFETKNSAYYERIYEAKKAGDEETAAGLTDYLMTGKGLEAKTITSGVKSAAKADKDATMSEKAEIISSAGGDPNDYVMDQVKGGELEESEALKILKEQNPDTDENDLWWKVDRAAYYRDTGTSPGGNAYYYRMYDAIDANDSTAIKTAVRDMTAHGRTNKQVQDQIRDKYKKQYLELPNGREKIALKNALIMAYKATGMTEAEAEATINGWKTK